VENNWADIMGSFGGPDMPHMLSDSTGSWHGKRGEGEGKTGKEGLQDFRETEISQKEKFTKE
jgi:hypothetical protein